MSELTRIKRMAETILKEIELMEGAVPVKPRIPDALLADQPTLTSGMGLKVELASMKSIVNGKLAIDGKVIEETSDVTGFGESAGYKFVHKNGAGQWWGKQGGGWFNLPASSVT